MKKVNIENTKYLQDKKSHMSNIDDLLKELQNIEISINHANNEFELMYDKVVKPFINDYNVLDKLHPEYGKESFMQFMKLTSESYLNMIEYKKKLNKKILKRRCELSNVRNI